MSTGKMKQGRISQDGGIVTSPTDTNRRKGTRMRPAVVSSSEEPALLSPSNGLTGSCSCIMSARGMKWDGVLVLIKPDTRARRSALVFGTR